MSFSKGFDDGTLEYPLAGAVRNLCVDLVTRKLVDGSVLVIDNGHRDFDYRTETRSSRYGLAPSSEEFWGPRRSGFPNGDGLQELRGHGYRYLDQAWARIVSRYCRCDNRDVP